MIEHATEIGGELEESKYAEMVLRPDEEKFSQPLGNYVVGERIHLGDTITSDNSSLAGTFPPDYR